ncbi:MAG: hypothetical protein LBC69_02660 [Eubacteriaceae bacterium]|jgi:hypothetical protein|nr:hypothetical protein [Eubacteriaceae bacterium]
MTNQTMHTAQFDQFYYTWADRNMSPSGHGLGIVGASSDDFAHIEEICRTVYNSVRRDGVPSRQLFYSSAKGTFVVANISEAVNTQSPRPCEMYHLYEYCANGRPIAECPPEEYLCPDTFSNSYFGENQKLPPVEFGYSLPSARELAGKYGLDSPARLAVFLDKLYRAVLERRTGFVIVDETVATDRLSDYACEMAVIIHSLIPPSARQRATFISNSSGQSIPSFGFCFCNRSLSQSDFQYAARDSSSLREDSIQHSMAIFMANAWLSKPDLFRVYNAELDRLINTKKISREEYLRVPFVFFGMHPEISVAPRAAYRTFKEMLNFYRIEPVFDSSQAQDAFVRLAGLVDDVKALKDLEKTVEKSLDSTFKKTRFFELLAQISSRDTQAAGEILEGVPDRSIPVEAYFYFTNTNRQDIFPISSPPLEGISSPMELRELYTNPSYYQDPVAYGESAAELSWNDPNFNNKTNYYAFARENGMAEIFENHSRQMAANALADQSIGTGLRSIKSVALKLPVAFAESDVFAQLWTEAVSRVKSLKDMPALCEIADYLGKQTAYRAIALNGLKDYLQKGPSMRDLSDFILAQRIEGDEDARSLCESYIRNSADPSEIPDALRVLGLFPNDGKLMGELQGRIVRSDDAQSRALTPSRIFELSQSGPLDMSLAQIAYGHIQANSSEFFEEFFQSSGTPDLSKVQVFLDLFSESAKKGPEEKELHSAILKELFGYLVSDHDKRLASAQLMVEGQVEKDAFLSVLKSNANNDECRILLLNLANREYERSNRTPAWKSFRKYCVLTRDADIFKLREFALTAGLKVFPNKLGEVPKGTVNGEYLKMAFLTYFLSASNEGAAVFEKLWEAASEESQENALRYSVENIVASPVAATISPDKKEYLARKFLDGRIPLIAEVFAQAVRKGVSSPETYLASLDQELYSKYLAYRGASASRYKPQPIAEEPLPTEAERELKKSFGDANAHKPYTRDASRVQESMRAEERMAMNAKPSGYLEEEDYGDDGFGEQSQEPWFKANVLSFLPAFLSAVAYKFLTAFLETQQFFVAMLALIFVAFVAMAVSLKKRVPQGGGTSGALRASAVLLLCVFFLVAMYGIDFFVKLGP